MQKDFKRSCSEVWENWSEVETEGREVIMYVTAETVTKIYKRCCEEWKSLIEREIKESRQVWVKQLFKKAVPIGWVV
jgi:hypothetical protein